jgi:para-aminobenzoate synthetase component 1
MKWEKTKLRGKESPCHVFRAVSRQPGAIFLETQKPSFTERYSLVACHPDKVFTGNLTDLSKDDFFRFLDAGLSDYFICGYIGYETCHWIEHLPRPGKKVIPNPDIYLAAYPAFFLYDHVLGNWYCWHKSAPLSLPTGRFKQNGWVRGALTGFDQTRDRYLRNVRRVLDYITAGDVYQINYTQRVHYAYGGDPFDLYLKLKKIQPVAYAAFIHLGNGRQVISGSPELFIRKKDNVIRSKPMKGTRKRSATPILDQKLRQELKKSRKDLAENAMIVDVMRNDLGRCCEYGSVRVPKPYVVEAYNTVYQMVSQVEGLVGKHARNSDIIQAAFPPASITGAPKVRAMEIISELEPTQRGVYCGTIGYFFQDKVVMNVAIRTLEFYNGKGMLGIGGGIVADSDPMLEYEESLLKAKAALTALGIA